MSEKFHFSSPEGEYLVQSILKSDLPQFEAHQDQLLGVCKVLDGVDLIVVAPTGSGKTGYIFMALVVMRAIGRDPSLCSTISFPKDPIIIVICPTHQYTRSADGMWFIPVVLQGTNTSSSRRT